ncbi:subclass B3 metallo-beta-lactamase [Sphingomonas sp. M1-B02]|uniref:subclass B3 metallo-beta-lactamase n=1 Tax=Sphingomonas sp. M1-B02 TaxID=3114300 RepID=UPI00223F4CB6|nr:subclass B3 metallo-beta-lactamase [Sphingomonas sp. S6-11]UZK67116.1 subclass B3 metallo-beta-lactamase [Sphingomonas sp. S6-11]
MMRSMALLLGAALAGPAAAQDDWAKIKAEWNQPMAPFRIVGDVYYVGTAGLSAFLITSPRGHILIDGAMAESVPQIAANIETLGFKLRDVKILLINHAHWDHSGGLAALKRRTGAKLYASAADRPALEAGWMDYRPEQERVAPVKVDKVIADGEVIALGGNRLTTRLTPGHTKGCTSWTTSVPAGADTLNLLFACSITVAGQPLTPGKGYDAAASDFSATFAKLRTLQADIFLAFHPAAFDMATKRARQEAGNANAFVDPTELPRRIAAAETAFEAELAAAQ